MLKRLYSHFALRISAGFMAVLLIAISGSFAYALSCAGAFQRYDYSDSPHLRMDQQPLSVHSLILDSNAVIALKKRGGNIELGRQLARDLVGALMKSGRTDLRITPTTAAETELVWNGEKPSVVFSRTLESANVASNERTEILAVLEQFEIGRAKGKMDRQIVTEAFLASTDGSVPTFLSADKGIYYGLLRSIGIEPSRLEKRAWDEFPDGFVVKIGKRSLRVLMIPPAHAD